MQYPGKCAGGRAVVSSNRFNRRLLLLGMLLGAFIISGCSRSSSVDATSSSAGPGTSSDNAIRVLSNRADLISGNDVLLAVVPPSGTAGAVTMSLNGKDVTSSFVQQTDGSYMGLVEGLALGSNVVSAKFAGGASSSYSIINHPNGGPVINGPQLQPWTCQAGAKDAQCNQAPVYTYYYQSTDPTKAGLQPYDPANPATDVASTTTDQGVTVPFIVRLETGYQDRDQYQIAILFQPGKPWSAAAAQSQFNHKLLITHGASCNVDYETGTAPSVLAYNSTNLLTGLGVPVPPLPNNAVAPDSVVYALGKGFAVMSTALDNNGHDCNIVTQAESLIMAKEHLIEQYGTLRYTIGTGCSGGSLAQQWIANAYPGIYQGILPTCSFPDTWTSATQVADYHLLNIYFGNVPTGITGTAGVPWTPVPQVSSVEGNDTPLDSIISDNGFFSAFIPTHMCGGITAAQIYNAQTNPNGVRCSIADMAINVFGERQPAAWTAVEKKLGHGFAGVPIDNVGVQYGLTSLQGGTILPDQFLDLNSKIGGLDIDANWIPQRIRADTPALANAYRSGMINVANNLDQTAIIDCRGPDPAAAHDSYRAYAIRARLDREHGTHANQLIWVGPIEIVGDSACNQNSLIAMDRWLAAVELDTSSTPIAQKIIADKPSDLGDACWSGVGVQVPGTCDAVAHAQGTPRMVAGDAITTEANKCQLKPLNRSDNYGPLAFTDAQWAQMQTLFPEGVCDFSKRGVSEQGTIAWKTYQTASGKVITGGVALPGAPVNSGSGWAGPAFNNVFPQTP